MGINAAIKLRAVVNIKRNIVNSITPQTYVKRFRLDNVCTLEFVQMYC
jgi:hypothetical protein